MSKPPEWVVTILLPIVLAILPEFIKRAPRTGLVCCACSASAPDLPHRTLSRLGWTNHGLMIFCPACSPTTDKIVPQ